jgi:transcriptional regulator with XRE-family HTH domain
MPDTTLDPNLARVIEEARTRKTPPLSQLQLARVTGLSLGTVRLACQGIATVRTLALLSRPLGVSIDELTGRKRTAQ